MNVNVDLLLKKVFAPLIRFFYMNRSTCIRCGLPWGFVTGHNTSLEDKRGCFPLCEACWNELKYPAERLPFYHRFWRKRYTRSKKAREEWNMIEKAVLNGG